MASTKLSKRLLAISRLFEFGTGFLPPETGAKTGLKAMSPRRDRKSETTTREKWPEKRPFYQLKELQR